MFNEMLKSLVFCALYCGYLGHKVGKSFKEVCDIWDDSFASWFDKYIKE